ncbi:programmed cell death protein 4a isoform X4 [Chiloscyllium plagiosum]|uniref:programmed cell death protein 4a isoform X4 n=1 Tax=Chiloscyllium plagiosum TaxID=36176 RepID=UPI001CB7B7D4|nr:programmed cell death protein 4a isoform X4 [Chiloscyllium plagiosum]
MLCRRQHEEIKNDVLKNQTDYLYLLNPEDIDDDEELNDGEVNGNGTPQEKMLREARIKAKAKRRLRRNSSRDSTTRESVSESGEPGTDPNSPKGKLNDRKSRSGKGRGLPKKGGAGGKGVWGAAGVIYDYEEPDARDPNYDDAVQGKTVYGTMVPELDENALQKTVTPIVKEYFEHGDGREVAVLGQFIARAVADDVLPSNFLDGYKGRVNCDHARAALDRAAVLLSMKRGVGLDNVWGVGGGQRPVKHLIREMNFILKEFLLSGELEEAEHCLRDLEVPHFHHELVYEAVIMVLESTGNTAAKMVKLLKMLWESGLVTLDQMNRGFQRVFDELPDINLDVPLVHTILEKFLDLCVQEAVITKQLRDSCPSRGRKRFVSEGDGGRVKE